MKTATRILAMLAVSTLLTTGVWAQKPKAGLKPQQTCPIMGGKINKNLSVDAGGYRFYVCCPGCLGKIKADPDKAVAALKAKGEKPEWILNTQQKCPITGAKLGSMGDPIVRNYKGRTVRFCCAGCPPRFEKDVKASLKKLDEQIIAEQKAGYPLQTCVVTGEKMGGKMGEPIDYVYENQLVRFCCKGCVKMFAKDPGLYLKKLRVAYEKKAKK